MKVNFKKLDERAKMPTYGSPYAAGADLYAVTDGEVTVAPNETKFIGTGIAVELPEGTVGLVYARSGMACKKGLAPANKVGVIDSDYRGEIRATLINKGAEPFKVCDGDRIAQLMFMPVYQAAFLPVDELDETERGTGGFGSTGVN